VKGVHNPLCKDWILLSKSVS